MTFLITDPTELEKAQKEHYLAKLIGDALKANYPSYLWLVRIDLEQGIAVLHLPVISPNYGCVIHLDQHLLMIQYKAIRLAGELLERFRLSRTAKQADYDVPRNSIGDTRTDLLKDGNY